MDRNEGEEKRRLREIESEEKIQGEKHTGRKDKMDHLIYFFLDDKTLSVSV